MDYPGKVITKTQVTPTQTSASGNWTLDDQAAAIKNNNWPVALVPNPISKSLRFNSADTAYLNRTPATATNRRTWTWSGWFKRAKLTSDQIIFQAGDTYIRFGNGSADTLWLNLRGAATNYFFTTSQVFRDVSSWYHLTLAVDTTQATNTNRVKLYVNGNQVTNFSTSDYPPQNTDTAVNSAVAHNIGYYGGFGAAFDGYMTEINFIDGQALTPSDFGLTNPQTGQWIPKKYTGTYGTNGFYLNFKDATSTTTLGYDYSGNANNWTTNNFSVTAGSGNDSLTDVPTPWVAYNTTGDVGGVIRGNYCTLNPLDKDSDITLSNGNLDASTSTAAHNLVRSTISIPSSGKWYAEMSFNQTMTGNPAAAFALIAPTSSLTSHIVSAGNYSVYGSSSTTLNSGATSGATVTGMTSGQIWQFAVDADNGKAWVGLNNAWFNVYTSGATTGDPANGTNPTFTATMSGLFFGADFVNSSGTINCGQRPFAYTPPAGFRSLCTTNLPATAIGFGLTNQANRYFDVVTRSANGSQVSISSLQFSPDFLWGKARSAANAHGLIDSVRGATKYLSSNNTDAETTSTNGTLVSFDSNGYTLQADTFGLLNYTGRTYVDWLWKAGGTGVTNTAGSITSTVSANTTAGFSIVTYTGNGVDGATTGHGLGVAPNMVIVKRRDVISDWNTKHSSLSSNNVVFLNSTSAQQTPGSGYTGDLNSSTTITFKNGGAAITNVNGSGNTYVAYCFAAVPGYSAFGSYTGNGSSDGPFVYLGFRPRFILTKSSSGAFYWVIEDAARNPSNVVDLELFPNDSLAETNASRPIDFLSNGFKIRHTGNTQNASGGTYIYAAFAESPFQFANAR